MRKRKDAVHPVYDEAFKREAVRLLASSGRTVNDDIVNPFGGVGASGNGSSVGAPANWEQFTHWQWMTIQGAPPAILCDPM